MKRFLCWEFLPYAIHKVGERHLTRCYSIFFICFGYVRPSGVNRPPLKRSDTCHSFFYFKIKINYHKILIPSNRPFFGTFRVSKNFHRLIFLIMVWSRISPLCDQTRKKDTKIDTFGLDRPVQ